MALSLFGKSAAADSPRSDRWPWSGFLLVAAFGLGILLPDNIPVRAAGSRIIVVLNDQGGSVIERARLIRRYRAQGTQLEIRGQFCMSACTMYLGLSTTCVAPDTVFGFHGPSSRIYGIGLRPELFEYWSRIMANHYPEPLKSWFLKTGRHRTVGFNTYYGHQLIGMGIKACPSG